MGPASGLTPEEREGEGRQIVVWRRADARRIISDGRALFPAGHIIQTITPPEPPHPSRLSECSSPLNGGAVPPVAPGGGGQAGRQAYLNHIRTV